MKQNFQLENIRIKIASLRDRETLLRLIKAYYRYDHLRFDRKIIERGLSELLKHPDFGQAWLICNGRHCVGYLILTFLFDLEFGGRQVGITDLFIYSQLRHMGVGHRVLLQLEKFCKKISVKSIELQVTRGNAEVVKFYQRAGYYALDRIPLMKLVNII